MRKLGSIVCKMTPVPSKRTNQLCTHAHHSDHSVAATICAQGTYFVDVPHITNSLLARSGSSLNSLFLYPGHAYVIFLYSIHDLTWCSWTSSSSSKTLGLYSGDYLESVPGHQVPWLRSFHGCPQFHQSNVRLVPCLATLTSFQTFQIHLSSSHSALH
jgi:hypothetical protein